MKKLMLIAVVIMGLSFGYTSNSYAQKKGGKVMVFGKKGGGKANLALPGEDKPREKKTKRGDCFLYLDNFTGYYVDVWVEDQYQG